MRLQKQDMAASQRWRHDSGDLLIQRSSGVDAAAGSIKATVESPQDPENPDVHQTRTLLLQCVAVTFTFISTSCFPVDVLKTKLHGPTDEDKVLKRCC